MSFSGVTFAKQKVSPSDDAIIRRAILPDGILTGCVISYSGSTLTMAAGQLMVCGRQIRHPAAQNWAVLDATSGYARLVLTIDLTRTATKDTFDQVTTHIEYASSEDGFVELEQSDINVSGTRYQIALCVVSLGTGGITGIVSQLGVSAVDGSGALNFSVVGGVAQPSDPNENTIWVSTPVEITAWKFASEQPEGMAEGEVWINTGAASQVAFNALKKGTLMVYPIYAKQMQDGSLADVTAKSWQNGEWVDWWNGGLYAAGDEFDGVTGGWIVTTDNYGVGGTKVLYEVIKNSTNMHLKTHGRGATGYVGSLRTANMVDLKKYETLYFDIEGTEGDYTEVHIGVASSSSSFDISETLGKIAPDAQFDRETFALDISAIENPCYVVLCVYTASETPVSLNVYNVYAR